MKAAQIETGLVRHDIGRFATSVGVVSVLRGCLMGVGLSLLIVGLTAVMPSVLLGSGDGLFMEVSHFTRFILSCLLYRLGAGTALVEDVGHFPAITNLGVVVYVFLPSILCFVVVVLLRKKAKAGNRIASSVK